MSFWKKFWHNVLVALGLRQKAERIAKRMEEDKRKVIVRKGKQKALFFETETIAQHKKKESRRPAKKKKEEKKQVIVKKKLVVEKPLGRKVSASKQAKKIRPEKPEKTQKKPRVQKKRKIRKQKRKKPKKPAVYGKKRKIAETISVEAEKVEVRQRPFRKTVERKSERADKESYKKPVEKTVEREAEEVVSTAETVSVDEEIKETKDLMKNLEKQYLKQEISEDQFKSKLSDLKQKLYLLELRKKKEGKGKKVIGLREVSMPVSRKIKEGKVDSLIEQKLSGKVNENKIDEIERNIHTAMKKHDISEKEVSESIKSIDKGNLVEGFDRLLDLLELEKETQKMIAEKFPAPAETRIVKSEKLEYGVTGIPNQEKIKAIATEISKHRIVTDFDRLLEYVGKNGRIDIQKAMKELKMDKKKILEVSSVLQEADLLKVEYPAIGSPVLVISGYKKPEKKKEEKKHGKVNRKV